MADLDADANAATPVVPLLLLLQCKGCCKRPIELMRETSDALEIARENLEKARQSAYRYRQEAAESAAASRE
eukprot:scaffold87165_cov21-Tisochrysis_lutea.AAC.1